MSHVVVSNRNSGAVVAQAEVLEDGRIIWVAGNLNVDQKSAFEKVITADLADGCSGGRLTGDLEWLEVMGSAES